MNRPIHIVVDNTFPKRLVAELREFWRSSFPEWTIRHENDIANPGTRDHHWIPRLNDIRNDGLWLVITSDAGKHDRKQNEKLPVVCKKYGHAYLIVNQSIGKFDQYKAAISVIWSRIPVIIAVCHSLKHEPSKHVKLGQKTLKGGGITYQVRVNGKSINQAGKLE